MNKLGQIVYILSNGHIVEEAIIIRISSGFYTLKFTQRSGAIKLKGHRLYKTKSQAQLASKQNSDFYNQRKAIV